ncbi:MAG: DUF805 domain-containing protein [Dehalococcoidia bacterium]|nr:DUF805 domain-containing protein [Dehalococcoidia bacterium]
MVDLYLGVLKKYVDFSGRASRREFWMFLVINIVIAIVLQILANIAGVFNIIYIIFELAIIVPSISVGVRRMHDTNRPGWWIIIPIIDIVYAASAGTKGANNYGAEPTA